MDWRLCNSFSSVDTRFIWWASSEDSDSRAVRSLVMVVEMLVDISREVDWRRVDWEARSSRRAMERLAVAVDWSSSAAIMEAMIDSRSDHSSV